MCGKSLLFHSVGLVYLQNIRKVEELWWRTSKTNLEMGEVTVSTEGPEQHNLRNPVCVIDIFSTRNYMQ